MNASQFGVGRQGGAQSDDLRPSLAIFVLGVAFLAWRATLGFDLRDGSYLVALAQRSARGEIVFRDELAPHILGSLGAAPILWVWQGVFGVDGVVLVARLTYVVYATVAAYVAWRAMRSVVHATTAAVGVTVAVLCIPYNIEVLSYNSAPQLLLLVSYAAGCAAVMHNSKSWAGTCSASAALAAVTYFAMLPAAVTLVGCVVLARLMLPPRQRSVVTLIKWMVLPGVIVGLLFVAWLIAIPEWTAVTDAWTTLEDSAFGRRGIPADAFYYHFVHGAKLLPLALIAALISALPFVGRYLRVLLQAGALGLLILWGGEFGPPGVEPQGGRYAGAVALAALVVFAVPVLTWLMRLREPRMLAVALILVPPSVVGFLTTAMVTMSGAAYGAYALAFSGPLLLLVISIMTQAGETRYRPIVALTGLLLIGTMVASLLAVIFNEGPFVHLRHRGTDGPTAGLLMGDGSSGDAAAVSRLLGHCPVGEVWAPGLPGAYVWVNEDSRVPQYWLATFQLEPGFDAFQRSGSAPDCVLAPVDTSGETLPRAMRAWLDSNFEVQDRAAIDETDTAEGPVEYGVYVRRP